VREVRWTDGDVAVGAAVAAALAGSEVRVLRESGPRRVLVLKLLEHPVVVKWFRVGSGAHPWRERVKARLGHAPAQREWRALAALLRAGLPVPEPLALGVLPDGDRLLVMRWVPGVPLADALRSRACERHRLLAELGEIVARLHAAGWTHGDLHVGNVMQGLAAPVLLDWQSAGPTTSYADRTRDLARLEHSLAAHVARGDRMRLRQAALSLVPPHDAGARALLRAAGKAADARAREHAASRTADALRPGRLCARVEVGGARGLRLHELAPEELAELVAAHRAALDAGDARVLERSHRARVTTLEAGGRRVVVKETPWRGVGRALADRLRGSAGFRAFRGGHGLRARGLGAPLPLAFLERRRLGLPVASWLVLEDLRPAPAAAFALEAGLDAESVLDALARYATALHRSGVDHGDLKATHLLLVRDHANGLVPHAVDLEGVRFGRSVPEALRLRALAQLNASLPDAFPAAARRRAFVRYARSLPFEQGRDAALASVVAQSLARHHRWTGAGCECARGGGGVRSPARR
jgi:tRNA A-37 threonylcarbamoyl transferase component Bud32